MTSVMHSEVRPAFLLSQWRTAISLSMMKFGLNICIVNVVVNIDDDGGKNEC